MDGVLVRFGEIGIKSAPVRRQMVERLRQNLLDGLLREGLEGDVEMRGPRLWMIGSDVDALLDLACRTFGVVSASPARTCPSTMDAMADLATEMALAHDWVRFAVRARRQGEHPYSSQEMGRDVGSAVWAAAEAAGRSPAVDLDDPDLEVHVEARQEKAYVYTEVRQGVGGLPMGSQGTVVCLVSDGASFVAAWLMMRRGCKVVPVHAGTTASLPVEDVAALGRWGLPQDVEVLPVCSGFVSKEVLLQAAARIAADVGAAAVVTGDTLDSDLSAQVVEVVPVLRPVCGLAPEESARWAAVAGVVAEYEDHVLDPASSESVESVLSMRRTVSP